MPITFSSSFGTRCKPTAESYTKFPTDSCHTGDGVDLGTLEGATISRKMSVKIEILQKILSVMIDVDKKCGIKHFDEINFLQQGQIMKKL